MTAASITTPGQVGGSTIDPVADLLFHAGIGVLALLLAWLALRALIALLDVAILRHIPTSRWMGWVCLINDHDTVDHVSDEGGPYRKRCVRCGWRHPLDGQ